MTITGIHSRPLQPSVARPQPTQLHRRSANRHLTIHPSGTQNKSLSSAPSKSIQFARDNKSGGKQIQIKKGTSTTNKAATVIGQVHHSVGKASYLTLLAMKLTKLAHQLKTGSYNLPGEGFKRSFKAFVGINIVLDGLQFIKGTGETVYRAVRDLGSHRDRTLSQKLLRAYNPETRSLNKRGKKRSTKALERLLGKSKSDLSRSKGQIALDRLTDIATLAEPAGRIAFNSLTLAGSSSKAATSALPGAGIALSALNTVYSAVRTASQVSALNNLAKAKAATNDPLLSALSRHIKNERTVQARTQLASTVVNAAATAVSVTALASGVGAPAAFIATGALGGAVSVGTTAFSAWHNRKLTKARDAADRLKKTAPEWQSLAVSNIGVAESAFLDRLRNSSGHQLKEAVTFLRNFGLTENTIKKLQLAPEATAKKTLQQVLYQDKVKYQGLQLKQTVKTLSHIVGFSALWRRIKSASLWLAHKLKPATQKEPVNTLGKSLYAEPDNKKQLSLQSKTSVTGRQNHIRDKACLGVDHFQRIRATV